MGVVYEAYHVDLSRAVALKVLPKERAASPQFAERFRAEARAIARLVHENLVGLHDFGLSSDNRPYYAMELLDGESLEQHLEREKGMDWREAARLACQACDALQVAHDAGVIHRDIKPANLFVTRSGTVKLLDFGIAAIDEPSESWDGHSGALSVVGTPEYMAPEQVRRQPCDARTDVYSLGTVLYELVTGGLPFSASNTVALLDAKTRTDPEPARQRAPERGLPIMLDKTIQRAVARDPAQRFQSAGELRQALVETLREPIRTRQRRRGIALAGLGVLALSFAATAAVGVMSPEIRARALAMVQPVLQKAHALRARAIASGATAATPEADGGQRPAEPAAAPAQGDKPSSGAAPDPAASETVGGTPTDEADGEPAAALVAAEQERSGAAADNVAPGDAQPEPLEDAFAAQPVSEATADDQVQAQIEQAAELMQQGARIKAFNLYRRAGQQHPEDPRALKAWSQAAVVMNGWGEAYRVASRWAEVDQSVEARVHLARMQRAVGKREAAMKTLAQLLEEHPRCAEAQQLLGLMTGKARVAMQ
jgi:tetratricopeptide (TPR) repeat protein